MQLFYRSLEFLLRPFQILLTFPDKNKTRINNLGAISYKNILEESKLYKINYEMNNLLRYIKRDFQLKSQSGQPLQCSYSQSVQLENIMSAISITARFFGLLTAKDGVDLQLPLASLEASRSTQENSVTQCSYVTVLETYSANFRLSVKNKGYRKTYARRRTMSLSEVHQGTSERRQSFLIP